MRGPGWAWRLSTLAAGSCISLGVVESIALIREATCGCSELKGLRDISGYLPARESPPIISRSRAFFALPTVLRSRAILLETHSRRITNAP